MRNDIECTTMRHVTKLYTELRFPVLILGPGVPHLKVFNIDTQRMMNFRSSARFLKQVHPVTDIDHLGQRKSISLYIS